MREGVALGSRPSMLCYVKERYAVNRRENALTALRGEKTEFVPCFFDAFQLTPPDLMLESPPIIDGIPQAGLDGFGVHQTPTQSADGAFTPTFGVPPVLTDVTEWKKQVRFPDYGQFSDYDWRRSAAAVETRIDRGEYVIDTFSSKGMFERMHALMGFEQTMIALMEEPEACAELAGAIADHKIRQIELVGRYYKPDYYTYMDDYSHKLGLFMSQSLFRTVFKPQLKRIVDATHANGMMFRLHCCGKMESLLDDFLELGITAFDPVQPFHDIPAMKKKTLGRAGLMGGLDVQGVVDLEGAPEEQIRAEVRRCIDAYAADGGYVLYGASIFMRSIRERQPGGKIWAVIDECRRYGINR